MSYVRGMIEADKAEAAVTSSRARRTARAQRANQHSGGRRETGHRRVGITLTGEVLAHTEALAELQHITPGEVVRRGIAVLKFLTEEEEKGSVLRIQSPTGETDRIRLIFA